MNGFELIRLLWHVPRLVAPMWEGSSAAAGGNRMDVSSITPSMFFELEGSDGEWGGRLLQS